MDTHVGGPIGEVWQCVLDCIGRIQEIVTSMLSLRQIRRLEDGRVWIRWWGVAGWWETLFPRLLEWIIAWVGAELDGSR